MIHRHWQSRKPSYPWIPSNDAMANKTTTFVWGGKPFLMALNAVLSCSQSYEVQHAMLFMEVPINGIAHNLKSVPYLSGASATTYARYICDIHLVLKHGRNTMLQVKFRNDETTVNGLCMWHVPQPFLVFSAKQDALFVFQAADKLGKNKMRKDIQFHARPFYRHAFHVLRQRTLHAR